MCSLQVRVISDVILGVSEADSLDIVMGVAWTLESRMEK